MGMYALAIAVIVAVLIVASLDKRAGWREGVVFACRAIDDYANRARVAYNHCYEEGKDGQCAILNGQVDILRSIQTHLEYEMQSRFMKKP